MLNHCGISCSTLLSKVTFYLCSKSTPPQAPTLAIHSHVPSPLLSSCRFAHEIRFLLLLLQMLVIEGLHPFHDERVRELCDVKIYLDISPEVKFAWKVQRDSKERGHSVESIEASIKARKPDFDAYIDPQKKFADIIIQVSHG